MNYDSYGIDWSRIKRVSKKTNFYASFLFRLNELTSLYVWENDIDSSWHVFFHGVKHERNLWVGFAMRVHQLVMVKINALLKMILGFFFVNHVLKNADEGAELVVSDLVGPRVGIILIVLVETFVAQNSIKLSENSKLKRVEE